MSRAARESLVGGNLPLIVDTSTGETWEMPPFPDGETGRQVLGWFGARVQPRLAVVRGNVIMHTPGREVESQEL